MHLYFEELIKQAYAAGYQEIEDCRAFIVPSAFKEVSKKMLGENGMVIFDYNHPNINEILENPLPFKVCCFETEDYFAKPRYSEKDQYLGFEVVAIAAIEKDPLTWQTFALFKKGQKLVIAVFENNTEDEATLIWHQCIESTIRAMLFLIKTLSKTAYEPVKRKIKLKNKSGKKFTKINGIIHIYPKKEKTVIPVLGGPIDYSHRFEVRGHWRQVKGVGKDRAGKYNMKGFTWVLPFTKGDEKLPLIKKTRLIHAENGECLQRLEK